MKVAVSKFEECENNSEVEKLNDEIKYLEKLLASKTKGANPTDLTLFKKKSCRYWLIFWLSPLRYTYWNLNNTIVANKLNIDPAENN